jgi:glycosyltransferase involved in cell wall biosynthesis
MSIPQALPTHSLKVAILHYACPPTVGGVESIMSTHAQLLQQAGHEPFLVAGRGRPEQLGLPGVILPEIDSRHREILHVQAALRNEEEGALQEFTAWTDRIYGLLLEALDGTDVCVVHNAFTLHKNLPLTIALARLAEQRQGAKRWIAWCHDLAWNNPLYQEELLPRWPWTPLKYPLPNVHYVAISERRLAEMVKLFRVPAEEITLVPNGIDPAAFIPFIACYGRPTQAIALGRARRGPPRPGAHHPAQEPGAGD